MKSSRAFLALVGAAALTATAMTTATAADNASTGPSTTTAPYVLPAAAGVTTTSVLTVGDRVGDYTMAGIPDGLGAWDNGDGTFTVLMNHELGADKGIVRAHGAIGAFVSKWRINKADLKVLSGEDLIKKVMLATGSGYEHATGIAAQLNRLCSADLPDEAAFYRAVNGFGSKEKIFMNGEEGGTEGRAFAHIATGVAAGTTYELPGLGKAAWENIVASPYSKNKTVTIGLDDGQGGQVYVYVGKKSRKGNDIERAGLVGGKLYGVKVEGLADNKEVDATTIAAGTRFSLVEVPGADAMTGAELDAKSNELGITNFARPEDGSWSKKSSTDFWFNTTASITGVSRTWHLNFDDAVEVTEGGTVNVTVAGPMGSGALNAPGPRMLDNMTTTAGGALLLQEDPGNQDYLAGLWKAVPKDPATVTPTKIMTFDPAKFTPGAPAFITKDEESSGIIPLPFLGKDVYLFDAQVHKSSGNPETVEMGQLLMATVPQ
ncbi:MAG: hypothetical protein U0Q08_11410 [Dermatophilaceae bacterium]